MVSKHEKSREEWRQYFEQTAPDPRATAATRQMWGYPKPSEKAAEPKDEKTTHRK